jgi:hypothetical protein
VHLRDGLMYRGRRFYDQAALFRPLRRDMGWLPESPHSADAGEVRYTDIVAGAPLGLPFAADVRIETSDQKWPLSPADLMLSMHRNFDALELLAQHDPSVTGLGASLLSNVQRQPQDQSR